MGRLSKWPSGLGARSSERSAAELEADMADASLEASRRWSIADEAQAVHVLGEHGAVRLENGRLSIAVDGGPPACVRLDDVAAVFLHGAVAISSPATIALMRRGAPLLWHGRDGRLIGHATGLSSAAPAIRAAQFAAAADPAYSLELARAFVDAKLIAGRRLLRRRLGADDRGCRRMEAARTALGRSRNADALRGHEGAAADAYFAAWPTLLAKAPAHLAFAGRSRRPPADPLNALLSYLYAVLHGRCVAAALAAGLEPGVGFLHSLRAGRHALALDLMEPFRPMVVDAAVLGGANNGEFPPVCFARDPSAAGQRWRLTAPGKRAALKAFERRLAQETRDRDGRQISLRQALTRQARELARALRAGARFAAFSSAR
jgi:CRISPR-associated endonuclease Cas1